MGDGYYDGAAARQQEKVAQTHDMMAQRALVRGTLGLALGESVLDVGSGNGIFAGELLADVGASGDVMGVDPAQSMIAMASAYCPKATFVQGSAESLPAATGRFDAVTASQMLCFVPDVDMALAEMFRVLRPGGRLVILDSDWDSLVWNCRDRDLLHRIVAELTKPYESAHLPRSLTRRLVRAGFSVTDRKVHTIVNWENDDASFSRQLLGFLESSLGGSDKLARGDREAWQSEQNALAEAGEYLFSLNRYVFHAIKP